MPKVTVVLPVYNGEAYLEEAIKSILNQTYKDFELIIVDDNSSDNTALISKKFTSEHANVIYVKNEQNLKLPGALNKGFSLASGDYYTWISDDNVHLPNMLSRLVEELQADPSVGLVYSDFEVINEKGDIIDYNTVGPSEDLIITNVVGACFLYRADIAKKAGGYNENMFLVEDYEYWFRLALITKLKPIHECLLKYRRHKQNLSAKNKKELIAKGIKIQKQYYKNFVHTRKQAARFYAYLLGRDRYNPFALFYAFPGLFYDPLAFLKQVFYLFKKLLKRL